MESINLRSKVFKNNSKNFLKSKLEFCVYWNYADSIWIWSDVQAHSAVVSNISQTLNLSLALIQTLFNSHSIHVLCSQAYDSCVCTEHI
jgi:hypothetical protein